MTELSLFTGIGGGCLASQHLLKHRLIGYVEKNEYCQKVIRSRIEDGLLDNAPIFGDIQTFIDTGYCEVYREVTDIVSAGFPCQPFSVAGKRKGAEDERNMWPATCEAIKRIKPCYAFLENVSGLTYSGYIGRILQDLAQIGYDAKWMHLSAANCGALHKRERLWIMAYPENKRINWRQCGVQKIEADRTGNITYSQSKYDRQCDTGTSERQTQQSRKCGCKANMANPDSKQAKRPTVKWEECNPWATEPKMDRVVNGVPRRMERIRALGNAQVPIVAATAFRILMGV